MDNPDGSSFSALSALGMATAAGFLIGFEREWTHRVEGKSGEFAGARTFALVGLIGGLSGVVGGAVIPAAAFLLIGALTIAAYGLGARRPGASLGATTEVALLATYLLGLAAAKDMMLVTAIGAVAVAVLLSLKQEISKIAGQLGEREIHATLRLLVVSVIILPMLPNEGYGPYGALNPRDIWKMVVFISGLSFVGYWMTKWLGAEKGVLLTGLVGGLASSTATTLSLARRTRETGGEASAYAAGIVAANVVMLGRIGVLFAVLAPAVLGAVWPPLAAGGVIGAIAAIILWRMSRRDGKSAALELGNPFELKPALIFAGVLGVISLAAAYGAEKFGDAGLYVVALISGLADVDAITLTAAKSASAGEIAGHVATGAALLAAASNIVVKAGMSFSAGTPRLGLLVASAFGAILAAVAGVWAIV